MAFADEPVRSSDQELIQQAKDGSRQAFRLLMERHVQQAYNVAYRFVGDHACAQDITQDAFVKAHAALSGFRGDSEFSTWLHRIVVNLALTKKRVEKSRRALQAQLADISQIPDTEYHDVVMMKERQAHIERALHELPTLQRAVVILRHLNGLSTKQVSDILKCSEGTVKVHLFRGLKKMKNRLAYLQ